LIDKTDIRGKDMILSKGNRGTNEMEDEYLNVRSPLRFKPCYRRTAGVLIDSFNKVKEAEKVKTIKFK